MEKQELLSGRGSGITSKYIGTCDLIWAACCLWQMQHIHKGDGQRRANKQAPSLYIGQHGRSRAWQQCIHYLSHATLQPETEAVQA